MAVAARRADPAARGQIVGDGLFYTLVASAGAFVLATPGILIDSAKFWHDVSYERTHVASGHGYVFVGTAPGWWYHVTNSLAPGLGWPLLSISGLALAWAIRRREPADGVLLAFVVPYYLLISSIEVKFARYTLPLFPPLCIWTGRALAEWGGWRGPA